MFNKQLTKLPLLKALNLQTEFVNRCFKPPISYEFLEVLFKLDSFIQPNGDPKGVSMVAGDTRNYVFKLEQYCRGGIPASVLIKESQYHVEKVEDLEQFILAGYPMEELRLAGFGIKVVKDCHTHIRVSGGPKATDKYLDPREKVLTSKKILAATTLANLKKAGYTISECHKEGEYSLFMLEEAKFPYIDMVRELRVKFLIPL